MTYSFEGVCLVLRASSGKHARFVRVFAAGGDSVPADARDARDARMCPKSSSIFRKISGSPPTLENKAWRAVFPFGGLNFEKSGF